MSYDLHRKLAEQFNGSKQWGYRAVDTLVSSIAQLGVLRPPRTDFGVVGGIALRSLGSVTDTQSVTIDAEEKPSKTIRSPVPWLPAEHLHSSKVLGSKQTTAQVQPRALVRFLAERFLREPNCSLVLGTVIALSLQGGSPSSILISAQEGKGEDRILECDTVVLSPGPWLGRLARELLPSSSARSLACAGQKAHTMIIRTREPTTPHCLFIDLTLQDGSRSEPEVYPRADGTAVICGGSTETPLPVSSHQVQPEQAQLDKLRAQANTISSALRDGVVETECACYLPISDRGRPIIGKVKGVEGVYVGGGLSCWGITQGPGTGLVLSEMILEGKAKTADVSRLAP